MRVRAILPAIALAAACAEPKHPPPVMTAPIASTSAPSPPPSPAPDLAWGPPENPPPSKEEKKIPDEPPDVPVPAEQGSKPAAHAKVDALLAAVESAEVIEIEKSWSGMRGEYQLVVRLVRKGDDVSYKANVATSKGAEKTGTTPFSTVKPFLHRLSRKRIDRKQDYAAGPRHTDDYPSVHVTIRGKALAAPLRLSVDDNQWHWRANGLYLAPDPPGPPYEETVITIAPGPTRSEKRMTTPTDVHWYVNASFNRLLALLGATDLVAQALKRQ